MLPNIYNNTRHTFAKTPSEVVYPDFLEIQIKSFQDFMQLQTPPEERDLEGLWKVFNENFPVMDARENFVLEFRDYTLDPPRYDIEECKARGLTYSVALKAKLYLYTTDPDNDDFRARCSGGVFGEYPLHDTSGHFCGQWF